MTAQMHLTWGIQCLICGCDLAEPHHPHPDHPDLCPERGKRIEERAV